MYLRGKVILGPPKHKTREWKMNLKGSLNPKKSKSLLSKQKSEPHKIEIFEHEARSSHLTENPFHTRERECQIIQIHMRKQHRPHCWLRRTRAVREGLKNEVIRYFFLS